MLLRIGTHRAVASLRELLQKKCWKEAVSVMDELKSAREDMDMALANQAIWGMCAAQKVTLAYKFLLKVSEFGVEPHENYYTAIIEGALRLHKVQLAVEVYYQSRLFGIHLDAAVQSELLLMLAKVPPGFDNAKYIWTDMRKQQLVPTAIACDNLLKAAHKESDWPLAEDVLSTMHRHHLDLPRKSIETWILSSKSGKEFISFKSLWQQIKASDTDFFEGIPPSDPLAQQIQKSFHSVGGLSKVPLSFKLILMPKKPAEEEESSEESSEYEDSSEGSSDSED